MGVDGVTGPLSSTGSVGDTGVAPEQARMPGADGGTVVATFSGDGIAIGGRAYPNGLGSQDPASLLLQLVGMGMAAP